MLCQKCWSQPARVHFTTFGPGVSKRSSYCLACAQGERLSWLLAWAYGTEAEAQAPAHPTFLEERTQEAPPIPSLVALRVVECQCGCRFVLGAEIPCHHKSLAVGHSEELRHLCHCGGELVVEAPQVVCEECGASAWRLILATVESCSYPQHRPSHAALSGPAARV